MEQPVPFGQRLQNVNRSAGEQKCKSCGIPRESHFIVNHIFVDKSDPEIWCNKCQKMYDKDIYLNHIDSCGILYKGKIY